MFEILGGIVVLLIMITLSGVKVVKEHERLVVFRYGKVVGSRGTGVQLVLPVIERALVVDTRLVTMPVEVEEVQTNDGAVVSLSLVFMFQVIDAASFVTKVADAYQATVEASETVVREATRERVLSEIQSDTRRLKQKIRVLLDKKIRTWGLKIGDIECKDVRLIAENRSSDALAMEVEHKTVPMDYFTSGEIANPVATVLVPSFDGDSSVVMPGFDGDIGQSYRFSAPIYELESNGDETESTNSESADA